MKVFVKSYNWDIIHAEIIVEESLPIEILVQIGQELKNKVDSELGQSRVCSFTPNVVIFEDNKGVYDWSMRQIYEYK
jgi:hypothetical protein